MGLTPAGAPHVLVDIAEVGLMGRSQSINVQGLMGRSHSSNVHGLYLAQGDGHYSQITHTHTSTQSNTHECILAHTALIPANGHSFSLCLFMQVHEASA